MMKDFGTSPSTARGAVTTGDQRAHPGARKQKAVVIDAILEGGDTSNEISEMTGIQVEKVSSYLTDLEQDGLIEKTGRWKRFNKRGQRTNCWKLVGVG